MKIQRCKENKVKKFIGCNTAGTYIERIDLIPIMKYLDNIQNECMTT